MFPTRSTNGGYRRALLAKYVHIEGKNARWVPSCIACYRCFHLSKRMASFAILYQQRRSHVRQKFKVAIAVPCLLQTFELFFIFPIFSKIERRRYGNYLHFLHSAPPLSECKRHRRRARNLPCQRLHAHASQRLPHHLYRQAHDRPSRQIHRVDGSADQRIRRKSK